MFPPCCMFQVLKRYLALIKCSSWLMWLRPKSRQAAETERRKHICSHIIISVTARQLTSVHIHTSATNLFSTQNLSSNRQLHAQSYTSCSSYRATPRKHLMLEPNSCIKRNRNFCEGQPRNSSSTETSSAVLVIRC